MKDLSELNLSKIDKTLKLIEGIKGRMAERDRTERENEEYSTFVETEYVQKTQAFKAEIKKMVEETDGIRMELKATSAKVFQSRKVLKKF